ncbi:hypothetical protein SAMD00023353_6200370 [Rosellinia necatrix]|uniref:Uncharacterized protein n=1 Tax=Rosellinia necatrix TaxID=77044 RepID=A0A1S8AAA2_ROSNE|nr:hypothetical protein SAMD00023353_6200370 [Rosellinia necatrix]
MEEKCNCVVKRLRLRNTTLGCDTVSSPEQAARLPRKHLESTSKAPWFDWARSLSSLPDEANAQCLTLLSLACHAMFGSDQESNPHAPSGRAPQK